METILVTSLILIIPTLGYLLITIENKRENKIKRVNLIIKDIEIKILEIKTIEDCDRVLEEIISLYEQTNLISKHLKHKLWRRIFLVSGIRIGLSKANLNT